MFTQNSLISETGRLTKFALRLTKNKPDADDLVQSTLLRALEKADYFEEGSNLFSWTSKIMFNIFVSGYRRRTKFESQYDPETYLEKQFVDPAQIVNSELAGVKRAMMKLSPEHRKVLILICAQGLRYDEVACMLHIPVGTVRSRLSRAREQLRDVMNTCPDTQEMKVFPRPPVPAYAAHKAF